MVYHKAVGYVWCFTCALIEPMRDRQMRDRLIQIKCPHLEKNIMVCKKLVRIKSHTRMCPGRKPPSTPKKGGKRKLQAPRAPERPTRKRGTSAMFKTFKSGVKVRKSVGVKKKLAFWSCNRAMWKLTHVRQQFHDCVVRSNHDLFHGWKSGF